MANTIIVDIANPIIILKKSLVSIGNTFLIFFLSNAVAIATSLPASRPQKTHVVYMGMELTSLKIYNTSA